eukprot:TRINITY_DN1804_c0_g1_i1.p1 TRINITY_DN1804_c0_g1~~TRINITY_DN1804_c0_g1_i1.p1  ORF type:complete len:486 (+),score=108.14 TRINITY_DN1804_c0_g1_i1:1084-2541(+)
MTVVRGRPGAVDGDAHRRSNLRYTAPGPPVAAGWLGVDGRRLGGGSRSRYYVLEGGVLTAVGGRSRRPSATPPGVEVGLAAAEWGGGRPRRQTKSWSSEGAGGGGLLVDGVRAGVRRWELVVSGVPVATGGNRSAGGTPLLAAARARMSGVVGSGEGATAAGGGSAEVSLFAPDDASYDAWLVALTRAARPPGAGFAVSDYYRLSHEIGGGVQATVYQGYDLRTAATVAVKVVGRVTGDAAEAAALAKEAATVAALSHPNIVATLDVFETPDAVYFVQEYLGGCELFDYIAANDTFTEAAAAGVMRDILSGLAALHDAGIAHRDVKLENLLAVNVAPPLVVKIADFGLCATVDGDHPDACLTDLVGTSFYLAPEILSGGALWAARRPVGGGRDALLVPQRPLSVWRGARRVLRAGARPARLLPHRGLGGHFGRRTVARPGSARQGPVAAADRHGSAHAPVVDTGRVGCVSVLAQHRFSAVSLGDA